MTCKRQLIVNADDFGQSSGVNGGVIEAHESGIVTSASLMVRWPAAAAAAADSRKLPKLSLGLHVDLGEWRYRDGAWIALYEVVPLDDVNVVKEEVARQLATFNDLVGKRPTHMDSHQHVHLREPARAALCEVARFLDIPLRHFNPGVHYCGKFYGQTAEGLPLPDAISSHSLVAILRTLPDGVTELGCHPGKGNDLDLDTMYRGERAQEVKTLCDPLLPTIMKSMEIELRSFGNLPVGYWRGSPVHV
jgi:chitin disaccharide deacetylase